LCFLAGLLQGPWLDRALRIESPRMAGIGR
jgi:hypothetical protein